MTIFFQIYIGDTTNKFWDRSSPEQNQSTVNESFGRKALAHLNLTCCLNSSSAERSLGSSENDNRRKPTKKCSTTEDIKKYFNVTLEDYNDWCTSFDKLMESEPGREIFRLFCEGEFSDENIKFWNTENFKVNSIVYRYFLV